MKRRTPHLRRFVRAVIGNPSLLRTTLPNLMISQRQRVLLREMSAFTAELPGRLTEPIEQTMAQLNREARQNPPDADTEESIRDLADFVVQIYRQEAIGFCLQRSLTRYTFLRRAGLPVRVHFGAKPSEESDLGLFGHAWLTLRGEPYFEESENWQGYSIILSYPQDERAP